MDDERRCWSCGEVVWSDAPMFLVEQHWCCRECFEGWLWDNFKLEQVADAIGVMVEAVRDDRD